MKTKSLAIVALIGLLASSQTGCAPHEAAAASSWRESVAVQMAAVAMSAPDTPTPDDSPDDGAKCLNCKGTGRVKTGDGISTTECDECEGTGVTAVGANRDDLLSRVYDIPVRRVALDEDGPPMRVQAADGGWRMMETPGQALAMAQPAFQSSLVPEDAAPYPTPEDQLAEAPVSQVAPVPDTQPYLPASPAVCVDGTCTVQTYSGAYVSDGCPTCGASYSAPASCGECGRPLRAVMHTGHAAGTILSGGGPIARAWANRDGPLRRAIRGEGPVAKAVRKRRGLFRRFRGC